MTTTETRVYATGHYALIAGFFVLLGVVCFQIVNAELHPAPLVEACPQPKGGK